MKKFVLLTALLSASAFAQTAPSVPASSGSNAGSAWKTSDGRCWGTTYGAPIANCPTDTANAAPAAGAMAGKMMAAASLVTPTVGASTTAVSGPNAGGAWRSSDGRCWETTYGSVASGCAPVVAAPPPAPVVVAPPPAPAPVVVAPPPPPPAPVVVAPPPAPAVVAPRPPPPPPAPVVVAPAPAPIVTPTPAPVVVPAPVATTSTAIKTVAKGFVLSGDLAFATNGANLSSEGAAALDELAAHMKTHNKTYVIVGNADYRGNAKANQSLSERRAKSVETYLEGKGIATDRLTSRGDGINNPVTGNSCKGKAGPALSACLADDRRVEINLVN